MFAHTTSSLLWWSHTEKKTDCLAIESLPRGIAPYTRFVRHGKVDGFPGKYGSLMMDGTRATHVMKGKQKRENLGRRLQGLVTVASVPSLSRLPTVMLNTGGRHPFLPSKAHLAWMGGLWHAEEDPAKRIMTFDAAVVPGNIVTIGFDITRTQASFITHTHTPIPSKKKLAGMCGLTYLTDSSPVIMMGHETS